MKKLTVLIVLLHVLSTSSSQVQAASLGTPNMHVAFERFVSADEAAHQCQRPDTLLEQSFQSNFDFVSGEYRRALAQQSPEVSDEEIRQSSSRHVALIKERVSAKIGEFGCDEEQVADWTTSYAAFAEWKPEHGFSKLKPTNLSARLEDPEQLNILYKLSGYVKDAKGWLNECGNPAQLSNRAVDLDADQTLEIVIVSSDQGCYGQVGPRNTLFKRGRNGKWTPLLEAQGHIFISTHRTNGHLDLVFGGSGYCGNAVYSWKKGRYSYKCSAVDSSMVQQCGRKAAEVCKLIAE